MYSPVDGPDFERRNSCRFPIHLEVTLKTAMEEFHAITTDISAGGILFHTEVAIPVDSSVEFEIEISAKDLGTQRPLLVKCQGRVVRCSEDASGRRVAVTIDEYQFVLSHSAD
jgi:c-di-GMP-binding flagellar brake protein YcgR